MVRNKETMKKEQKIDRPRQQKKGRKKKKRRKLREGMISLFFPMHGG